MFVAFLAETHLSAGSTASEAGAVELTQSYALRLEASTITIPCGQRVRVIKEPDSESQLYCTLGGLLVVNGKIMGLTAGHPFSETGIHTTGQDIPEAADIEGDMGDDDSSWSSSDPFVFNDYDSADTDDESIASSWPLNEYLDIRSASEDNVHDYQTNGSRPSMQQWYLPQATILLGRTQKPGSLSSVSLEDHDWALLEALPPVLISYLNRTSQPNSCNEFLIKDTATDLASGEVSILNADINPRYGHLHSSPATMQVNGATLIVQLIILDRTLRKSRCVLRLML